jgi:hypothetical protein
MKKKDEINLEDIIRYYGSLEAYNEEQRRCCQAQIETAVRFTPFAKQITIENARPIPVEVVEVKATPKPRRFWLKLFGQKA